MGNLGRLQKCEGRIAFRVDPRTHPPGTRLHKYYMYRYAQRVEQVQSWIEAGPASLVQHLTAPLWQNLDLNDSAVGLASDMMKMMVVLEAIFEHARKMFASHLPSRLDCVFVWPTLESARKFRQQYMPGGVIHRCILQGEAVELDSALLPPGIDLSDLSLERFAVEFQATQIRAQKYWLAQGSSALSELLVVGHVEVVGPESEPCSPHAEGET